MSKLKDTDITSMTLSSSITQNDLYHNLERLKDRLKKLYNALKTKTKSTRFQAAYHEFCDVINFRDLYPINSPNVSLIRPLFIQHIFEQWNQSSISERTQSLTRMQSCLTLFRNILTDKGMSGYTILKILYLCIKGRLEEVQKVDRKHSHHGHHSGKYVNYGHITPITETIYVLQYFTHIAQRIDDIIKSVDTLKNIDYGNIISFENIKNLYQLDTIPGWKIYNNVKFQHSDPSRCIHDDDHTNYDASTFCSGCGLPRQKCTCKCGKCKKTFNKCQCDDIDETSIVQEKCQECGQINCICPSSSSIDVTCTTCKQPIDTSFLHIIGIDRYISFFHPQCSVPVCESCNKYISVEDPSSVFTKNGIRYHRQCYYDNEQKQSHEYGLCEYCNQPSITFTNFDENIRLCAHLSCMVIANETDEKSVNYDEATAILIKHNLLNNLSFGKRRKKSVKKIRKNKKSIRKPKKSVRKIRKNKK